VGPGGPANAGPVVPGLLHAPHVGEGVRGQSQRHHPPGGAETAPGCRRPRLRDGGPRRRRPRSWLCLAASAVRVCRRSRRGRSRLLRRGGHHLPDGVHAPRRRPLPPARGLHPRRPARPRGNRSRRRGLRPMSEPTPAEQAEEIARLRRRLERERSARSAAEQLAEDATRRLYLGLEEQRRTAALLRAVVDASRDAISAKDCEGRFTMVNAALASIVGCAPEELLGQSVAPPGVNGGWTARIAAMDQRVVENKAGEQAEETIDGPDGRRHVLSVTKEPLLDEEGAVVGVCTVSRDLTSERQA